jgi:hypothetical protein
MVNRRVQSIKESRSQIGDGYKLHMESYLL